MKRTSLKDGWTFARQGKSQIVTLPHVSTGFDGQDGGKDDDRAPCSYERKLPTQNFGNQSLYLECETAGAAAGIFVNGLIIATHKGHHAIFRTDITSAVKKGEANLVRVDIDYSASESADHRFDACLIVTPPVRISLDDEGSSGVYVIGTHVTSARADLAVDVLFDNVSGAEATVECVLELSDADGAGVAGASTRLTFSGRARRTLTLSLDKPHLSAGDDNPHLYALSVRLLSDGVELDRRDIPTGLYVS